MHQVEASFSQDNFDEEVIPDTQPTQKAPIQPSPTQEVGRSQPKKQPHKKKEPGPQSSRKHTLCGRLMKNTNWLDTS